MIQNKNINLVFCALSRMDHAKYHAPAIGLTANGIFIFKGL